MKCQISYWKQNIILLPVTIILLFPSNVFDFYNIAL
jgi:hypothetical protein